MSTYAIGDIQGCFKELTQLLDKINFNENDDLLWFVGDLVNRGPESLQTVRFVKSIDTAIVVLGNHDLHLLAVANKIRKPHKINTIDQIIEADDSDDLLEWLRHQSLLVNDPDLDFTMIHAGLPLQWSLDQAKDLAQETESLFKSDKFNDFLHYMYGDKPDIWSDSLKDYDRHRFIINCFTRIRYVDKNGKLDLNHKGAPGTQPESLTPWYASSNRKTKNNNIIFGHWSTVHLGNEKNFKQYNVYPLDTGCLWGGELTAMRLEDEKLFSVPSQQPKL